MICYNISMYQLINGEQKMNNMYTAHGDFAIGLLYGAIAMGIIYAVDIYAIESALEPHIAKVQQLQKELDAHKQYLQQLENTQHNTTPNPRKEVRV